MKKVVSVVLITLIMLIGFFTQRASLLSVIESSELDYHISVINDDYQLLELSADDYKNVASMLNLEIVNKLELSDRIVIEGYSNKLQNHLTIDNKKINIQISITENLLLVGSPLIYDSF